MKTFIMDCLWMEKKYEKIKGANEYEQIKGANEYEQSL